MTSPLPSGRHTPLAPGAEFDRIRTIWTALGAIGGSSGDDCAIVEIGGVPLALSTDMSIEGTHFRTGWLLTTEIGWRATTAALSDLAAVAATPEGVLVSVGIPPEQPDHICEELMLGVGDAVSEVGATVWGGDLVRSDRFVVDVAVIGRLEGAPVRRRGAKEGDVLLATGRFGGPAAALAAWAAGREPPDHARERFARPMARIAEAAWLRDRGATAMIDVSDGLLADAAHLAAASGVACHIELDDIPPLPALDDPALGLGGEEYELLVTVPAIGAPELAADFVRAFDLPLTPVGRIARGEGVVATRSGRSVPIPQPAFRHFLT